MKRRSFIAMAASTIPGSLHRVPLPPLFRGRSLSAYGGFLKRAFQQYVAKKFTAETNIPVRVVSQSGDDAWVFGLVNAIKNGLAPVDLTIRRS